MNIPFTFHEDPGHGWLAVDVETAQAIGLTPEDFSNCSYRLGTTLYLEEDADATLFAENWRKLGREFKTTTIYYNNDCFVRSLNRLHS
jgi:hypothetical protein